MLWDAYVGLLVTKRNGKLGGEGVGGKGGWDPHQGKPPKSLVSTRVCSKGLLFGEGSHSLDRLERAVPSLVSGLG